MSNHNFFKILRTKLEQKPKSDFDKRFWKRFDEEFGEKKSLIQLVLTPVPVAATILIIGFSAIWVTRDYRGSEDVELASALMNKEEFLDNLEMLRTLDEVAVLATDEDWQLILDEGESPREDQEQS